jgi:WD40 repeat protein
VFSSKPELLLFSPDSSSILFASKHGGELWDAALTRRHVRIKWSPALDDKTVGAFAPDGTRLALTRGDGDIHLFDLTREQPVKQQTSNSDDNDDHNDDDEADDVAGPFALCHKWEAHTFSIYRLFFSPDGKCLTSVSHETTDDYESSAKRDLSVRIWDAATCEEVLRVGQAETDDVPLVTPDAE